MAHRYSQGTATATAAAAASAATHQRSGANEKQKVHCISSTTFTLDVDYSDLKILGKGSYGVVVSAFSDKLQRKVAIKKISPVAKHAVDATHVLREVRLMRYMGKHANVVTMEDIIYHASQDELYIVMELMDSDLHRVIQSKQVLTQAHVQHFLFQLLAGTAFLHSHRIIHRDLKPGNLLITKDCKLRISDFGLARERPLGKGDDPDNLIDEPMTEHVVTRWYRPPELMLCPDGLYDYSVDVWSCGCIFGELLGRNPMFPGKNFVHQLSLVFDVIGSPKDVEVRHIVNEEARKFLRSQANKVRMPFSRIFPEAGGPAWHLLDELLVFDAAKRPTALEAMEADYFHMGGFVPPSSSLDFPRVPREFEFSFERQKLPRLQLKQLIVAEIASFKKEKLSGKGASSGATAAGGGGGREDASVGGASEKDAGSSRPAGQDIGAGAGRKKAAADNKPPVAPSQKQLGEGQGREDAAASATTAAGGYMRPTANFAARSLSAPKMRPSKSSTANSNAAPGVGGVGGLARGLLEEVMRPDAYDKLIVGSPVRVQSSRGGVDPFVADRSRKPPLPQDEVDASPTEKSISSMRTVPVHVVHPAQQSAATSALRQSGQKPFAAAAKSTGDVGRSISHASERDEEDEEEGEDDHGNRESKREGQDLRQSQNQLRNSAARKLQQRQKQENDEERQEALGKTAAAEVDMSASNSYIRQLINSPQSAVRRSLRNPDEDLAAVPDSPRREARKSILETYVSPKRLSKGLGVSDGARPSSASAQRVAEVGYSIFRASQKEWSHEASEKQEKSDEAVPIPSATGAPATGKAAIPIVPLTKQLGAILRENRHDPFGDDDVENDGGRGATAQLARSARSQPNDREKTAAASANPSAAGSGAAGAGGTAGVKKKITVPKSPRFSTMSWQRKQMDFLQQQQLQQQPQQDQTKRENGKRFASTGRSGMRL